MTLDELYIRAESQGIEVDDFPMREVVAVSVRENWIAIDTRRIKTRREEKVILAHEMGHCETNSFYNVYSPYEVRGKHEYRANKRSYQILVPYEQLIEAVENGMTEIWELADHFDVPCDFMYKAAEYWRQQEMEGW